MQNDAEKFSWKRYKQGKPYPEKFHIQAVSGETVKLPVICYDGKGHHWFERLVKHVHAGSKGQSGSCANALGSCEKNAFAFKVIMAEFRPTRALLLVQNAARGKDKKPYALKFRHSQGGWQDDFDVLGKDVLIESGRAEGTVALSPLPKRKPPGQGKRHGSTSGPDGRKPKVCKGAIARARKSELEGFTFL